jgi:hypothetical protein
MFNGYGDDTRASDGADLSHDAAERDQQNAGIRDRATPYSGPGSASHTSSMASRTAGPTDPVVRALKQDLSRPKRLTPGCWAAATECQDDDYAPGPNGSSYGTTRFPEEMPTSRPGGGDADRDVPRAPAERAAMRRERRYFGR